MMSRATPSEGQYSADNSQALSRMAKNIKKYPCCFLRFFGPGGHRIAVRNNGNIMFNLVCTVVPSLEIS